MPMQVSINQTHTPIAGSAPGAPARSFGHLRHFHLTFVGDVAGIDKDPVGRGGEGAHGIGFLLGIPQIDRLHAGKGGVALVLLQSEEALHQIRVGRFALVPALQAKVTALEHVELLPCRFGCEGRKRSAVVVVLTIVVDDDADDVLVHAHCVAVASCGSVESREEIEHLEGQGFERSPDTAEVVAHAFTKTDSIRAMTPEEAGFCETSTDGGDDFGRPRLLYFARLPESIEKPL